MDNLITLLAYGLFEGGQVLAISTLSGNKLQSLIAARKEEYEGVSGTNL